MGLLMAKYKKYDYNQTVLLPLSLSNQLQEGTLEFYINNIVNDKIDMTVFDDKYSNDESGSPAYDPKILLKVILLAYSRGLTSSRRIEQACKENIVFMALTCGMAPDHSTISGFICKMKSLPFSEMYCSIAMNRICLAERIFPWTDVNCLQMPPKNGVGHLRICNTNKRNWKRRCVNSYMTMKIMTVRPMR